MEIHVIIASVPRIILISRNKNSSDRYLHKNCCTFEAWPTTADFNFPLHRSALACSLRESPSKSIPMSCWNRSKRTILFQSSTYNTVLSVTKHRLPIQIQILHSKLLLYSSTENSVKKG